MIQDVKAIDIDSKLYNIVAPVLCRKAFSCLAEKFLSSLLYSDNPHHRQIAVDCILQIRTEPRQETTATVRHIPELNFDAENWGEIVDIMPMICHKKI
jgi:hypothetical protein